MDINSFFLVFIESKFKKFFLIVLVILVQAGVQYLMFVAQINKKYQLARVDRVLIESKYNEWKKRIALNNKELMKIKNIERVYACGGRDGHAELLKLMQKSNLNLVEMSSSKKSAMVQVSAQGNFHNFYELMRMSCHAFPGSVESFLVQRDHSAQGLLMLMKWRVS